MNNWNTYRVLKAYQNGNEYNIWSWYIIGWDMSWITITSSVSFTGADDVDSAVFYTDQQWCFSIINWDTLYWVISWIYHDRRYSSNDRYNSVIMTVKKEPRQDFVFNMTNWTHVDDVWRGWNIRVLSNGTIIRILTSYYERTRNDRTDTADYDIWDFNPANMTVLNMWTWELSRIVSSFKWCDASEFWYDGFTDISWPVPWYVNWWFTNLQFNNAYYPKFVLA